MQTLITKSTGYLLQASLLPPRKARENHRNGGWSPRRFGRIEDAKQFCQALFAWYNQAHHHAGIGLMTPDQVHYGQADAIHAARQATLDRAFATHPEHFVKQPPTPPHKPTAAWINPPQTQTQTQPASLN